MERSRVNGVVSMLDPASERRVQDLWRLLEERFGVRFAATATPIPHFSYHVAAGYDLNQVSRVLADVATKTAPFEVSYNGLGVFPGDRRVIYLAIEPTSQLRRLHLSLFRALKPMAIDPLVYYAPAEWVPHVTLAHDDVPADRLEAIMLALTETPLQGVIAVDNLGLISDTGDEQLSTLRVPLRGK